MAGSRSWDDIGYREAIENCRTWNAQMGHGRRERLPFFDDHTQVHQNKCGLYVSEDRRRSGSGPTVIRYPGRKWKRSDPKPMLFEDPIEERDLTEDSYNRDLIARALTPTTSEYLATFDEIGDDFGDEDYGGGRRKGGKRTRIPRQSIGGGPRKPRKSRAKPVSIDDDYDQVEPTHFCGLCGKSFIHKSALTHHIKNVHDTHIPNSIKEQMKQEMNHSVLPPPPPLQKMVTQKCVLCNHPPQPGRKGLDLLLICTDCKKGHHPECMNFTPSMTIAIQKYNWQCTDCKSCNSCGKTENDDAILFCDNCDRGFHLYCLDPPLKEAPTGTWLCRHCKQ